LLLWLCEGTLRWDNYFGLPRWAQGCHMSTYNKEAEGSVWERKGVGDVLRLQRWTMKMKKSVRSQGMWAASRN
jgi:hypothetical protein